MFSAPHPYALEISHVLICRTPQDPIYSIPSTPAAITDIAASFKSRPFTFVDSLPELERVLLKLETLSDGSDVNEIAVDLEHHGLRTYQGLTSLMQVRIGHPC